MSTTTGKRLRRAAALAAAVAVVATGCASSGGTPSSSGTTTPPATTTSAAPTTPAPTGTPIKIGVITSKTGSQASSCSQGATVAPAWADWVNANGGINGHPVEVDVQDQGDDPAKAQAVEKKFASEGVVAILVDCDNIVAAFDDAAIKAGIPLVGGASNNGDWYSKAGMFVTPTDVVSGLVDQMVVAKQYGKATKFANTYCAEVAACGEATKLQQPMAAKIGIGYTSMAVSSTSTSYTAQCLQLKQQGVDYVQLNFTTAAAAKFMQDCVAQGYNPTWGSSEQAIGPDFLKIKGIHVYGPAYAFPSTKDGTPFQTFRDAMGQYAKDGNWKEGTASFGWGGLEMLHKVLGDLSGDPTAKAVLDGLNSVKDENLDGLLANKVTFVAGKPAAFFSHPCAFVLEVKDGALTSPSGTVCASA